MRRAVWAQVSQWCSSSGGDTRVVRFLRRWARARTSSARCSWTEADYRLRIGGYYLDHAEALTADQMHQRWRIKPTTLRTWAARGLVAKRGRDTSGRALYDVAQAKAARDKREEAS